MITKVQSLTVNANCHEYVGKMRMWIRIYIRILPVAHPQICTSAFYQSPRRDETETETL